MKMKKLFLLIPVIGSIAACTSEKGPVPVKDTDNCDSTISYSADIAPIMTDYCISCHTAGGSGTGDFTTYTELKQKADNGSLKNRVVDLKDMPQAGSPTISEDQRKMINCWIKQGAPNN
ncbi:MAG: cytochrome c [Bacteroidetes bacterium]|nr:cytochrome c [Bacteroidota bacterium]